MRTLVVWGAGRIGRGFVADIFDVPEFRTVFVDIDKALVDALNTRKQYTITRAERSGITTKTRFGGFSAVHTSQTEELERLFEEPELILDIALHEPKLPEAADMLLPLIAHRAESGALPMDIMMNVNMARPDEYFTKLMCARLSGNALDYFKAHVGVTGIFAMCISPLAPDELKAKDPLALWNNGWKEQAISRKVLKCAPPVLPRLRLTDDIEREETRKLYTLNMAHALLCYLGLPKGLKTSYEAVNDPELRAILDGALLEASMGLEAEFGFDGYEMSAWREKIVELVQNPYIDDALQRLGADTRRKLGPYDRLAGPIRLCKKAGGKPVNLIKALRAGYYYENPDEGTQEVRAYTDAHGESAAILKYSGFTGAELAEE